jgi:asparagine synthase (glutamine-hydrolysing)
MCGIAGIVAPGRIERLSALLEGFSISLMHRGPDDAGFLTWDGGPLQRGRDATRMPDGRVALIHRRLSIVDLSARGWQPMVDATGRYTIVLNGEIYNHVELRRELEAEDVEFRSQTDTEVLLQLFSRRGLEGLQRVVGMFAFAFFDGERRRLSLVRDPFGIKPLFFSVRDGVLAFASEIRPLLDLGFARRVVEPGPLFDYLRHAVTDHGEQTPFAGVRQLMGGHFMVVDVDDVAAPSPSRYWSPSFKPRARSDVDFAANELRELFADSVRLHLRADVPVATTLSGGIDSSAIAGTIARVQGRSTLATFSYIADDPAIGEEPFVDAAAASAGVVPRKIHLDADQLAGDLDSLILQQEQPFTTTSMWAQNRVFHRVHGDGFKVVLDGQGADELFAGYPVFRAARLASLIRRADVPASLALIRSLPSPIAMPLLRAAGSLLPRGLQGAARRLIGRSVVPSWLDGDWFARHGASAARPFQGDSAPTELAAQLFDATTTTSLPMLLRYADRNAMAFSLENRVPFLTTALADFAFSLPDDLLVGADGTTKTLLRAAMRGIVPDLILDRRDKIGFATPERRWFDESAALRRQLGAAIARPLPACFRRQFLDRLRAVAEARAPYSAEIWRAWNVLRWAELLRLDFPA